MAHVPCQRCPGLALFRYGGQSHALHGRRWAVRGTDRCTDHTCRRCRDVGLCRHLGTAVSTRGRATPLARCRADYYGAAIDKTTISGCSSYAPRQVPPARLMVVPASPRILATAGAERNVVRSGSSAASELAKVRIVARLRAWWCATATLFPVPSYSAAAVACTRQAASGTSKSSIADSALVMHSCARSMLD